MLDFFFEKHLGSRFKIEGTILVSYLEIQEFMGHVLSSPPSPLHCHRPLALAIYQRSNFLMFIRKALPLEDIQSEGDIEVREPDFHHRAFDIQNLRNRKIRAYRMRTNIKSFKPQDQSHPP